MKYLIFNELEFPERITKVFEVRNKKTDFCLGIIEWDTAWRRYIYFPAQLACKLDYECLLDIAEFIDDLMEKRKK